jgi:hypothetical protein
MREFVGWRRGLVEVVGSERREWVVERELAATVAVVRFEVRWSSLRSGLPDSSKIAAGGSATCCSLQLRVSGISKHTCSSDSHNAAGSFISLRIPSGRKTFGKSCAKPYVDFGFKGANMRKPAWIPCRVSIIVVRLDVDTSGT